MRLRIEGNKEAGDMMFTHVRALLMDVIPYVLPRDQRGLTLEASLWYDCMLSYELNPLVYIDTGGG